MKAADFIYHRASTLDDALRCLDDFSGGARVLAGGQSLMPMLNMRLVRPSALVDINGLEELGRIEPRGDRTHVGALVRYVTLETSPLIAGRLPLVARMVRHVADRQVRNRGTIGGSLVQGDPTAEMPLACLVLGATVEVRRLGRSRSIPMEEFYEGSYAAALASEEIVTGIDFPAHPKHTAFREVCRRHNDFAVLSVAAAGHCSPEGRWTGLRLALGGVSDTPVLAAAAMARLDGTSLDDDDIEAAAEAAVSASAPHDDMRASAEYRRHLIPIYVQRTLADLRRSAAS